MLARGTAEGQQARQIAAVGARKMLPELARMREVIKSKRFRTGAVAGTRQFIAQAAELIGLSTGEVPVFGDPASADTLDSASNQLAVAAAGSLSRVTNMSLTLIKQSLPNLDRTPEGNSILVDVMERTAERKIQIATLTQRFVAENVAKISPEELQVGLDKIINDLDEKDPIITEELAERIRLGTRTKEQDAPTTLGTRDSPHTPPPRLDESAVRAWAKELKSGEFFSIDGRLLERE